MYDIPALIVQANDLSYTPIEGKELFMQSNGYRVLLALLCGLILLLLGVAGYQVHEVKNISGPIAVAAVIVVLLFLQMQDMWKEIAKQRVRRKITVLIEDFLGKAWWATVELDDNDCLVAPKKSEDRVLAPAEVAASVAVLRSPPIRSLGNALEMMGACYKLPRGFSFKN